MSRPQPRTSALAGLTPALPAMTSPAGKNKINGDDVNASDSGKADVKITITIAADIVGEARAAYWKTGHLTGTRSFSQWVAQAVETELAKARADFNGGKAFEILPAGRIPTGRR